MMCGILKSRDNASSSTLKQVVDSSDGVFPDAATIRALLYIPLTDRVELFLGIFSFSPVQ